MNITTRTVARTAMICAALGAAAPALASTVKIKNMESGPIRLSDLVVWDKNGFSLWIRKPGDPSDDEILQPGESIESDLGNFEIDAIVVSFSSLSGEHEALVWGWAPGALLPCPPPRGVYWFNNLQTQETLHSATESQAGGTLNLPVGMIATVVGGHSPQLPGLFIGTQFDFQTGTVSGPFTGQAVVAGGAAEVQVWQCYADCNCSDTLTVSDFGCFQTHFALQDPYADCNGDGSLTVSDFGCFQTKFVAGCS